MVSRRALAWILLVPLGPLAIVWAFLEEFFEGVSLAFRCACNAGALEIRSIRQSLKKQNTEVEK